MDEHTKKWENTGLLQGLEKSEINQYVKAFELAIKTTTNGEIVMPSNADNITTVLILPLIRRILDRNKKDDPQKIINWISRNASDENYKQFLIKLNIPPLNNIDGEAEFAAILSDTYPKEYE